MRIAGRQRPLCTALSKPQIPYTPPVGGQIVETLQPVEMVNRQVADEFGRHKPDLDGHAAAAILLQAQAAPAECAGAGRAEENFEHDVSRPERV